MESSHKSKFVLRFFPSCMRNMFWVIICPRSIGQFYIVTLQKVAKLFWHAVIQSMYGWKTKKSVAIWNNFLWHHLFFCRLKKILSPEVSSVFVLCPRKIYKLFRFSSFSSSIFFFSLSLFHISFWIHLWWKKCQIYISEVSFQIAGASKIHIAFPPHPWYFYKMVDQNTLRTLEETFLFVNKHQ